MFEDRAFHIQTVYVNSLDPNEIVWRLGNPQFRNATRVVSWFVLKGIFSQDVAKEGR